MPSIPTDRYPRYDELTEWLDAYADEFPDLVRKSSIGQSYEGRELWLLTVTDHSVGAPSDKPAIWIDGNIHASEVTASVAIVHLIGHLTRGFGVDPQITRARPLRQSRLPAARTRGASTGRRSSATAAWRFRRSPPPTR